MGLFSFLTPVPVHVLVRTDHMEVVRLDTGARSARSATVPFSNTRIVLAHFQEAAEHLKSLLDELFGKRVIGRKLHFVIQQLERTEGGLSSVEETALKNMCEHNGGYKVKVVTRDEVLGQHEVLALLKEK